MTIADVSDRVELGLLDNILATQRPFADSDYINAQLADCYRRTLLECSEAFGVAAELMNALDGAGASMSNQILGDSVVRSMIRQLRRAVVNRGDNSSYDALAEICREVLDATVKFVSTAEGPGPLSLSRDHRLGTDENSPWIWVGDRPKDDLFAETFKWLVRPYYGELYVPSADEIEALRRGARLLEKLLPLSSGSALRHTHIVALVPSTGPWQRLKSSSQYLLGGAIFLSKRLLDNPWLIAQQLYHESLHQKLYDFRHAHTLLAQDSSLDLEPNKATPGKVRSLWNYPDNVWDSPQALAAFHVYVHLALLCTVAEQRSAELEKTYGPKQDTLTGSRVAFDRAHYLGEKLRSLCWSDFGRAGQLLVEWLVAVLDTLDPSPPPAGSYVHLLLNRYLREAERVQKGRRTPETAHQAELLTDEETAVALRLLNDLDENAAAEQLRATATVISQPDPISRFAETRQVIASALRNCCGHGYSFLERGSTQYDPDEVVAAMVERSSRLLVAAQQIDELDGPSVQQILATSVGQNGAAVREAGPG